MNINDIQPGMKVAFRPSSGFYTGGLRGLTADQKKKLMGDTLPAPTLIGRVVAKDSINVTIEQTSSDTWWKLSDLDTEKKKFTNEMYRKGKEHVIRYTLVIYECRG